MFLKWSHNNAKPEFSMSSGVAYLSLTQSFSVLICEYITVSHTLPKTWIRYCYRHYGSNFNYSNAP